MTEEQRVYVSQGFLHGDGAVRNATIAEQSLADEIERLQAALREYGQHSRSCHKMNYGWHSRCDCGFEEVRMSLYR